MAAISKLRRMTRLNQHGFTTMQMLIVVALVAVVSAFGFIGIQNVRAEMRLQNSARRFAIHLEKARLDSVRRRAGAGGQAWIQSFDPGTGNYLVTMDFDGTGAIQSRTFQLDPGITFGTNAQTVAFDWRGRIPARAVFGITNGTRTVPVDVSGSGDITLGDQSFADDLITEPILAGVPTDVVPDPTPFPIVGGDEDPPAEEDPPPPADENPGGGNDNGNGNGNGNGGDNGNGNPHASPSPTPAEDPTPVTPTTDPNPGAPPCTSVATPSSLTLSQRASGQQTGNIYFTLSNATGAHSITATQAGAGKNVSISVSPATLSGSGTAVITVGALHGNGNRGNFTINISSSPTCGTTQKVTVIVGN